MSPKCSQKFAARVPVAPARAPARACPAPAPAPRSAAAPRRRPGPRARPRRLPRPSRGPRGPGRLPARELLAITSTIDLFLGPKTAMQFQATIKGIQLSRKKTLFPAHEKQIIAGGYAHQIMLISAATGLTSSLWSQTWATCSAQISSALDRVAASNVDPRSAISVRML